MNVEKDKPLSIDFKSKETPPSDTLLMHALGPLFSCYEDALSIAEAYDHEWKFYGAKYGWNLKVTRKGKALFYVTPSYRKLLFGLALRPQEKEAMLASRVPESVKTQLRRSKKVMEGYPLTFEIETIRSFGPVRAVIRAVMSIRG